MSIVVTSNIVQSECGFPINPITNLKLAEMASVLKFTRVPFEFLDAQKMTSEEWVKTLLKKDAKLIIIQCDEAFLQELKTLKASFEKTTLVAVVSNQDLTNTLIFDYGIDYVYWSENYTFLSQLAEAVISPFTLFYDHVPCISYKNGLGELTKTEATEPKPELVKIYSLFCLDHINVYLPFGYQIDAEHSIEITNGAEMKVLTDLDKFDANETYTSYLLKVPANKKASAKILSIIESPNYVGNLSLYPSCDIKDDKVFYTNLSKGVVLAQQIKTSGFIKRFLLKLKLNKLR
jgi:hypothetical protein